MITEYDARMIRHTFPNFDLATLPDIPDHWTGDIAKEDGCPAFVADYDLGHVFVFIQSLNPDERHPPSSPRFKVDCERGWFESDDWDEVVKFADDNVGI